MNIQDLIRIARRNDQEAAEALREIATNHELWHDHEGRLPSIATAEETAEMVKLLLVSAKSNHPDALVRLGLCFWYGEGVGENLEAACKCWYNAYEISQMQSGGIAGFILGGTDRRAARRMEKAAGYIVYARRYMREREMALVDGLPPGHLFDLSAYCP